MTPIVYEFDHLPTGKTLNRSQGTSKAGMAYRARLTREVKVAAFRQIDEQRRRANRPPLMMAQAVFKLTFFVPTQGRRGVENLIAAAKPYMDAVCPLEIEGVHYEGDMVSDDWPALKHIDAELVYRKGKPGFRITITPVEVML